MPAASPQQHRILRQVIELQGCSAAEAAALQSAVSQLFHRRLLPVIEGLCNALGETGRVQRIERLEIDLGVLDAAAWRGSDRDDTDAAAQASDRLVARFEAALGSGLAEALHSAPAVVVDVELVASALQHGSLPWWADAGDREALARALAALLVQPAPVWRGLLPADASGDVARRRLVGQLDDTGLARLAGRLVDDPEALAWAQPAWAQAVAGAAAALGADSTALRRAWWCEVLALALQPGGGAARLWPLALRRWAEAPGAGGSALAPALRRALDQATLAPGSASVAELSPLWRALDRAWPGAAHLPPERPDPAAADGPAPGLDDEPGLAHALAGLGEANNPARAMARQLAPRLAQLPLALRRAVVAAWAAGPAAAEALRQACLALLQQAQRQGLVGPDQPGWPAAAISGQDPDRAAAMPPLAVTAAALARALAASRGNVAPAPPAQPAGHPPTALKTTEVPSALYLANAGLVLLWPFLARFFDRLGLLEQGRFCDQAAAERGALLLQCVASGDAQAPEFQLPLNKLLCGLPPEHLLLPGAALGDDEQAECEALLQAVIASAPILRQMSTAGFRGSFLLRSGQLAPRDGHWLLRVERQSWDLVVARFPWPIGVVRLPWMPALLQVEWPLS